MPGRRIAWITSAHTTTRARPHPRRAAATRSTLRITPGTFCPRRNSYDTFEGTRQIFYTEMGYASQEGVRPFSDAFAWASDTTDSEQAEWLAEAAQLSIDTEIVRAIMVWNVDFVRYGDGPQDGFAILRPDESCPACDALHEVLDPPTPPDED